VFAGLGKVGRAVRKEAIVANTQQLVGVLNETTASRYETE